MKTRQIFQFHCLLLSFLFSPAGQMILPLNYARIQKFHHYKILSGSPLSLFKAISFLPIFHWDENELAVISCFVMASGTWRSLPKLSFLISAMAPALSFSISFSDFQLWLWLLFKHPYNYLLKLSSAGYNLKKKFRVFSTENQDCPVRVTDPSPCSIACCLPRCTVRFGGTWERERLLVQAKDFY